MYPNVTPITQRGARCPPEATKDTLAGRGAGRPACRGEPEHSGSPFPFQATSAERSLAARPQASRASSSNSSASFFIIVPPSSSASTMVTARR